MTACGSDNTSSSASGSSAAAASCSGKTTLKASGSTAQANAMSRFIAAYNACSGYNLDYTASGSGAGVNDFIAKQTDFAGSDSPLDAKKGEIAKAATACGSDAWNLPLVFGPIAVTYNLDGVTSLSLDATVLAKIFSGAITTWNDPAIAALNAGVTLPSTKISVIYRSDQSGTTDNFQKYLTAAGKWSKGAGKTFNGGVGEGAKGNDGTSQALKNTPGAITYNEWSFAQAQKLSVAKIVNAGGGTAVDLTAASAAKAVAAAKVSGTGNDLRLDLTSIYNSTTAGAYPIILATYEIVCSKYSDAQTSAAVKSFLTIAANQGQDGLGAAGYVPLPDSFKSKFLTAVSAIS
jgi:phosphate transport system substrate-binding protein